MLSPITDGTQHAGREPAIDRGGAARGATAAILHVRSVPLGLHRGFQQKLWKSLLKTSDGIAVSATLPRVSPLCTILGQRHSRPAQAERFGCSRRTPTRSPTETPTDLQRADRGDRIRPPFSFSGCDLQGGPDGSEPDPRRAHSRCRTRRPARRRRDLLAPRWPRGRRHRVEGAADARALGLRRGRHRRGAAHRGGRLDRPARLGHEQGVRLPGRPGRRPAVRQRDPGRDPPARPLGHPVDARRARPDRAAPVRRPLVSRARRWPPTRPASSRCRRCTTSCCATRASPATTSSSSPTSSSRAAASRACSASTRRAARRWCCAARRC